MKEKKSAPLEVGNTSGFRCGKKIIMMKERKNIGKKKNSE